MSGGDLRDTTMETTNWLLVIIAGELLALLLVLVTT